MDLEVTVTERKKAEDALRVSETRYRRLFESAKDGILILDADTGRVVDANPFKEKGKGTGLGLSTVYGIVKQSGGTHFEPEVAAAFSTLESRFRQIRREMRN